jgi:hypothetical protein
MTRPGEMPPGYDAWKTRSDLDEADRFEELADAIESGDYYIEEPPDPEDELERELYEWDRDAAELHPPDQSAYLCGSWLADNNLRRW